MSDKKSTTSKSVFLKDSATVPKMQVAPESRRTATASAEIPKMQLAPGTKTPIDKSASPSGDQKSTKEGESK